MARKLACSFCGKGADMVEKLVAGPGVHICGRCVELCNEVIARESGDPFSLEDAPDDALLASLPAADAAVDAVAEVLHRRVAELRRRGIAWERIGKALGVSRQAVWERFR